jgi:hypothetical protein
MTAKPAAFHAEAMASYFSGHYPGPVENSTTPFTLSGTHVSINVVRCAVTCRVTSAVGFAAQGAAQANIPAAAIIIDRLSFIQCSPLDRTNG